MIDKCECTLRGSLVGDGCRHCQPQTYIDNIETWLKEEREETERLTKELATAKHNLKGAEAMCEMQMSLNRKLQAQLSGKI
jgi:hypothetical protein